MGYDVAARKLARAYVGKIRARTKCAKCGQQPIEWHHKSHEQDSNRRVAHLTALANRPFKCGDKQPPKPCKRCRRLSNPRWREMCRGCYDRKRRHRAPTATKVSATERN